MNAPEPQMEDLATPPVSQYNIVDELQKKIDLFVKKVDNYSGSKKQLQRVMVALAIHPFNQNPFQFSYPEQRELFDMGVEIVGDKLFFLHLGIEEQKVANEIKRKAELKETSNENAQDQSSASAGDCELPSVEALS
jgi:hypothetical protein